MKNQSNDQTINPQSERALKCAESRVFMTRNSREESELDMTPMVDVTFLLLIFFMVTASFVMQKSMNRPALPDSNQSSRVDVPKIDDTHIVEVSIAADNTYYVVLPDQEPIEAPSEQDVRIAMASALEGGSPGIMPKKMLIRAHEDSYHGRVITAMDIGADMNLPVQVQITVEDI